MKPTRRDLTKWPLVWASSAVAEGDGSPEASASEEYPPGFEGGAGHLYLRTTNPAEVNGSGIAMAARAGAHLAHLEFVQFHPTALDVGVNPMPLLTEALRGEGAVLVDENGHRYLADHHPDAELAPRDVVSRAVWSHQRCGHSTYLDGRNIPEVKARFPTVANAAAVAGLNPAEDLLPVSPAAHYLMGGIHVGTNGQTSVPNLWAVGEAACTGVHGANRLASNSLLEGLVFATRVASDTTINAVATEAEGEAPEAAFTAALKEPAEMWKLRRLMWENVGLIRTRAGLEAAASRIEDLQPALAATVVGRAAVDLATRITAAALSRSVSHGSHYRADHHHPVTEQVEQLVPCLGFSAVGGRL